jgi:uncharacterized membrane protein YfcA
VPVEFYPLAALVVLAAYLVRGITGFGSAMIAVPPLALMMPLPQVVPVIAAVDHMAALGQGLRYRREARWAELLPLLPFSALGVLTGLYLLRSLDPALLTTALGAFLLSYGVYRLLPRTRGHAPRLIAAPAGLLGGLAGTLFGTGAVFYVVYFQLRGLEKGAFRASISMLFVVDGGMRVLGFLLAGHYDLAGLLFILAAAPLALAGLLIGARLHDRVSVVGFQRLLNVLILIAGVVLLTR